MQTTQNTKSVQEIQDELARLTNDARDIIREIDEAGASTRKHIEKLDAKVDESIRAVEQAYSELDQVGENADAELGKLLEQAEDLSEK